MIARTRFGIAVLSSGIALVAVVGCRSTEPDVVVTTRKQESSATIGGGSWGVRIEGAVPGIDMGCVSHVTLTSGLLSRSFVIWTDVVGFERGRERLRGGAVAEGAHGRSGNRVVRYRCAMGEGDAISVPFHINFEPPPSPQRGSRPDIGELPS